MTHRRTWNPVLALVLCLAMTLHLASVSVLATDAGYTVTFSVDSGVDSIDLYYTQDYTTASETGVTTAVSRDGDTGAADSSGSGQVNFLVNLKDGYAVSDVTATEGTYKNVKTVDGYTNVYRVTKITGDTTVTVTTEAETSEEETDPVITFSDSGITTSGSTDGYTVSDTTLTITAAGTYTVTGSCTDGAIVVNKSVTGVTLNLSDLTLTATGTAPLVLKKSSAVTLDVSGTVTLTDGEDPDNEDSTDTDVADAFEGAAIKVKSGASLTITGDGTLNVDGSSCKNGIKGGATSTVTVDMDGTLSIEAANTGLASDNAVVIASGTIAIVSDDEGIKAEPDEDDTDSAGTVTISGGTITIDAGGDGIQAAGDITISDGTFDIDADSDGIQTGGDLDISGGTFDITTLGGYQDSSFDGDTMSCKGLKASTSEDDTDTADTTATNTINITGGEFTLNTADDAVHSDAYVVITGGTFDIYTGDDGVHADTSLTLGAEDGLERDPYITVHYSYEGLEAGNVYIYGGKHYVYATDDGINAAGGSSSGSDAGGGGGNNFNPGGGPGSPGQQTSTTSSGSYSLNIYGGKVFVNAQGDGLDSNGNLTLSGGEIEAWGQSSGDNEPMDYDGTLTVKGATVFAAGCQGMGAASPSSGSQTYRNYTTSISSGKLVSVKYGSTTLYQAEAPKAASYVFFSSPSMSSSATVSTGSGSVNCQYGNAWTHDWDDGAVTTEATETSTGVMTYTCADCGATERQTIGCLAASSYVTELPVPEQSGTLSYTGAAQAPSWDDAYDEALMTLGGTTSATDAGSYTATFTLVDTENYRWVDDTTAAQSVSWSIDQASATVTAEDASKVQGEEDPALSATVSGLYGEDTLSYDISRAEGESAGTYTITVSGDETQGNYSVSYVDGTFTIDAPSVSLGSSSLSLSVGSSATLSATTVPSDATVTWASSDSAVATVSDSGVVTAVAKGSATITATMTYNETEYSATCAVTVTAASSGSSSSSSSSGSSGSSSGSTSSATTETATTTTNADGSVTKTTTAADGTTVAVTTDAAGETVATEAVVSEAALATALKTGEAIRLPVTVSAAQSATLSVALPTAGSEVKVNVQVEDGSSGTVAWLKAEDGTLRLIKNCTTEDGLTVPVSGSCALVIADNSKEFTDVPDDAWYADSVRFVAAREMFNGYGARIRPNDSMTRAMVAQVLYNYDSAAVAGNGTVFADVNGTDWFNAAVGWASENGIVEGYQGVFGAQDAVTRQDLVTILYRYAKSSGYLMTNAKSIAGFTDAESVADYAKMAMSWAVGNGIINGIDGALCPKQTATRAQVAAILQRFITNAE